MIKWFFLFLFLLFVYHVREVFPPFIVGGILAYLLNPFVSYVCKKVRWINPGIAVAIIYFGTIGIITLACVHFGPVLASQFKDLFEQRHEMVSSVVNQISTQMGLGLDVDKTTSDVLASVESAGRPEEIVHFGGLISKSLLAILVCTVSSIYLILDSARVGNFFLRFVPPDKRLTVLSISNQMNVMLSKYVSGQLILILIMSCVSFGILTLFHVRYALLIGIVCGFLEIIPVLGPLLAIGLATIVGCTQLHFDPVSLGIPLLLFIARQIEDYVVVPKVIGHAVELHPLAVIFAVLVGETMAGALGMLIAIPVAASIKVILDFCYPPESIEKPKEHGGMLAWLIGKFKGRPTDRSVVEVTPVPQQSQESHIIEWANDKSEVRNEDFAEQTLEMNDTERHLIREATLIKLEENKNKPAAIIVETKEKQVVVAVPVTEPTKVAEEKSAKARNLAEEEKIAKARALASEEEKSKSVKAKLQSEEQTKHAIKSEEEQKAKLDESKKPVEAPSEEEGTRKEVSKGAAPKEP